MTKLAIVISGTLFSAALVVPALAADKAPAPGAVTAPPTTKPPTPAPVAAKDAPAKAGAPAAGAPAAGAPAAGAAAAAPSGPPTPSPEVEALFKALEGSWKCETTYAPNAMGPGSPETKAKSEVKIKKDLGGFWYRGDYKVKKGKTNPEFGAGFALGYDAGAKAAVSINADSFGGYGIGHAPDATPEKAVFMGEGHMMGMKVKTRETMTKKDAKNVEHTFEVDMGKGLQLFATDACKK
jgi:hypothetical protein